MRAILALFLLAWASAAPAAPPEWRPGMPWAPTEPYVVAGQDEPGYRNWYLASPLHAGQVKALHDYLTAYGVGGVVPTWQLLRTASDWYKCGAAAFEVPPTHEWPNLVQTLRYIRDRVIPTLGPVEPVSVYRNPMLNQCAGGAQESAHRFMQAVDMVPLRPITRASLIHQMCAVHASSGAAYGVGLGFYVGLRFHIDSRKFRKWGAGSGPEAAPCLAPPAAPPPAPVIVAPAAAPSATPAERGR